MRRRGSMAVALSLVGLSFALTACLGSQYAYISHINHGVELYFKVPSQWKVFSAKQLVEAANGPLSQTQINQIENGTWETSFSASPSPSIKQLITEDSKYPNGVVFAKQLSQNDRDVFSLAAMRAEILGQDPLAASTSSPFNVLSYSEFSRPGGIRGSKLITDISAAGGVVETFGQVIAVDPNTNYVYGIGLSCKASCWGPNGGLINQVLNSWNVKEQSK